jgi:hypothetical protein
VSDEAYARYVRINLPHSRTIVQRISRNLELLGAFREGENGGALELVGACERLERAVRDHNDDPPFAQALDEADRLAGLARALVEAVLNTSCRGDRLGQSVRNLFECLGLPQEGADLALRCGEAPDSLLR